MKPDVHPFFHADSNTWSYLVHDPSGDAVAVIDPVLDYDAKAARITTASAQALVGPVSKWMKARMPAIISTAPPIPSHAMVRNGQSLAPPTLPRVANRYAA